jgi:uncharacterized protein YkvS
MWETGEYILVTIGKGKNKKILKIKGVSSIVEFKEKLEETVKEQREEEVMIKIEKELVKDYEDSTVEGIIDRHILEAWNEDVFHRPGAKGGGGDATGERKDKRLCRRKRVNEGNWNDNL